MNRQGHLKSARFAAVAALAWAVLAGCWNGHIGTTVPPERLRTIDTLDLAASSVLEKEAKPAEKQPPSVKAPAQMDVTLEQCRAAALEHNLDLKVALVGPTIAKETVNQEEARFEALFFSNFGLAKTDTPISGELDASQSEVITTDFGVEFPLRTGGTVTFDLPLSRTETDDSVSAPNPAYTADFTASISQPLLRNAGTRTNTYAIRIARYEARIAEARTKLEITRVIADVDRIYWRLYAARRVLEVRKSEYDLARALLARAERKVAAGTASEVEEVRAETGVAERLEGVIIAENSVRQRERELKRALNKPGLAMNGPTVIVPATEPDPVHYELDRARLVKAAVENRMEMLELECRIAQDAATIDFQRNQTLPALALGYTYNVNGLGPTASDAFDVLLDKRFEDHVLGLELAVPLGNKAAESRLRQALLTRAQRLATRDRRRLQIEQEVLNALDQLDMNWQRVLANRQRAILAARNLRAEERQFELGLVTSTDVLDAQTRLGDAQSAEISALVDYQIAQVDLAYATGTLLGAARIHWEPADPQTTGE